MVLDERRIRFTTGHSPSFTGSQFKPVLLVRQSSWANRLACPYL